MNLIIADILRTSLVAALTAVVVFFARLLLKGAPRWITCLLWGFVALRLVCPVLPESELSIVPRDVFYTNGIALENMGGYSGVETDDVPVYHNAESSLQTQKETDTSSVIRTQALNICGYVWLGGVSLMMLYGVVSVVRIRLCFADAVLLRDNVRMSEKVDSPFVMGFFKPRIYIPFNLDKKTRKQVLLHEQAHIKRCDHITKPLGFALLCLHWFNPVMWVSYILFCRDVEFACDEKVIKNYKLRQRKTYATALLQCKMPARFASVHPLAFGETRVGVRIKKTLRYRKPAAVIGMFAMVLMAALSLCLLTDPVSAVADNVQRNYSSGRVTEEYSRTMEAVTEPATQVATQPQTEPQTQGAESYEETYVDDYYEDYSDDYYEDTSDDNNFIVDEYDPVVIERSLDEIIENQIENNPYAEYNERARLQRQTEYYTDKFSSFGNGNFNPFQPDLRGFETKNPTRIQGAPVIKWDDRPDMAWIG